MRYRCPFGICQETILSNIFKLYCGVNDTVHSVELQIESYGLESVTSFYIHYCCIEDSLLASRVDSPGYK